MLAHDWSTCIKYLVEFPLLPVVEVDRLVPVGGEEGTRLQTHRQPRVVRGDRHAQTEGDGGGGGMDKGRGSEGWDNERGRARNTLETCSSQLPYRGFLSREKTFANCLKTDFRRENFREFAVTQSTTPTSAVSNCLKIDFHGENFRESPQK